MLTAEEIQMLESLLVRARHAAIQTGADVIGPGDVVQLRPGSDPHWNTSLLLVCKVREDGGISGQILRPHRSGLREAWYTYRLPEVAKLGRMPFPEPGLAVRSAGYLPLCPSCHNLARKPVARETGKVGKKVGTK
jgi:hypothetical protein